MDSFTELTSQWLIAVTLNSFDKSGYQTWIDRQTTESSLPPSLHRGSRKPLASLLINDSGDDRLLEASLRSILARSKAEIQVVIATTGDRARPIERILSDIGFAESSAAAVVVPMGCLPADADNAALAVATGVYVAFLTPGDLLAPEAIQALEDATAPEPFLDIVYSDEDWLDEREGRQLPRFKTGWDPDSQLGRDLLGRLCFMRRATVAALGGVRPKHAPARHYDLHCRMAFSVPSSNIRHVPLVLYHRRMPSTYERAHAPEAANRYAEAARAVAAEHARALCGQKVEVIAAPLAPFVNRVRWPLPEPAPLVSVLIPTRDRVELVRNCVRGVLDETNYPTIEVLILDNDSCEPETKKFFSEIVVDPRVRVIPSPGPFNYSRINNRGVVIARGEILVFLNNDITVIGPLWLREMVSQALRPDIGCVGAKLLFGDGRVQHCGIVLKPGPMAMHAFRLSGRTELGYDAQLASVRSFTAVTAACLAIRRCLFEDVGGFDEQCLKVSYNDVDLGLKVDEHGYRNICTPFEPLYHLEGVSRGQSDAPENQAREKSETMTLWRRWSDCFLKDPWFHPNVGWKSWNDPEELGFF